VPDRGGDTPHLIPLLDDQFALDLTEEQAAHWSMLSDLIQQIQMDTSS